MQNKFQKVCILFLCNIFLFMSLNKIAHAMTIEEAKTAGYVGEQYNGYLGLVTSHVPSEVIQELNLINEKRKKYYENIAKENHIPLSKVEMTAGNKLVKRAPLGEYVLYIKDKSWSKK